MKKYFLLLLLFSSAFLHAQLSGGFENNTAWYIDDEKIKLEAIESQQRFRSNSYLRLDYQFKNFTTGIQLESYEPKALLNYSPNFKGTNLGSYYLNYSNKKIGIEATLGHFYEKFGSGLVFRTWEDRQLGIANSIVGSRIKYTPINSVVFTTFYGKQRLGFKLSESKIFGANADVKLASLLGIKTSKIEVGLSYVNRNEFSQNATNNSFTTSARINYKKANFTADFEYVFKSKEPLVEFGEVKPELLFDGDAYLINTGYSKKGFGVSMNLRRTENFGFFSKKALAGNIYNEGLLNYVPSLTKQFDYNLTNIYVYQAQTFLSFEPERNKAGEIGGQIDLFYTFKKGSVLGGKSGTNLAINYSNWYGLKGRYEAFERKYQAEFLGFGEKYYQDFSIEIKKNVSKKWLSTFSFLNQFYNARFVEESVGQVRAQTVVLENSYNFKGSKTIRLELQHQWANASFRNWASTVAEYNFTTNWSVFASDLYNYGSNDLNKKIHYYNVGGAFNKNAIRFQLGYGRQRGGLVCVGGVCRFVPENSGLSIAVNYSF